MLVPDTGRQLPVGWRPPVSFPLAVWYRGPGRVPDTLWTTPLWLDDTGRVSLYMACGPAGAPAAPHLMARFDRAAVPHGARVKVLLDQDRSGRVVYGRPYHTAN